MSAAIRERLSRPNTLRHLRARLHAALGLVLIPFFLCLTLEPTAQAQGHTTRVSVSSSGEQGDAGSGLPSISGESWFLGINEARYVAYRSRASNLVSEETGDWYQIYVHDRQTGETTLVSKNALGEPADSDCIELSISADGRLVAYESYAGNLHSTTLDKLSRRVYLHDRQTGETRLLSTSTSEFNGVDPVVSSDGSSVAYLGWPGTTTVIPRQVYVHDLVTGLITIVSLSPTGVHADAPCGYKPAISETGRYVAFSTAAMNLVPGGNGFEQIYVHDRDTGETRRASVNGSMFAGNDDSSRPVITSAFPVAGSVMVAFTSRATNLVPGPTSPWQQIYLRDMEILNPPNPPFLGTTQLISVNPAGLPGNSLSSATGISRLGRYVCFNSDASDLVDGDTNNWIDVFVRDRVTNTTSRVSTSSTGEQANSHVWGAMDRDGRTFGLQSFANNLVPGDTNSREDVFVHDLDGSMQTIALYCSSQTNSAGCTPHLTTDGSPSASDPSGFTVRAHELIPDRVGIFFFGRSGPSELPFGGGTICVAGPHVRTPVMLTGSGGGPCGGELAIDLNAYSASLATPAFQGGDVIWGQFWSRDQGFPSPNDTNLTSAVWFTVKP